MSAPSLAVFSLLMLFWSWLSWVVLLLISSDKLFVKSINFCVTVSVEPVVKPVPIVSLILFSSAFALVSSSSTSEMRFWASVSIAVWRFVSALIALASSSLTSAIRLLISASKSWFNSNSAAFALSSHLAITFSAGQHFNEYWRVATLERYVHGGNAIIMSHCPAIVCVCVSSVWKVQLPFRRGNTSPMICHSGCPPDGSIMSQE